jgi:hypothetical protein
MFDLSGIPSNEKIVGATLNLYQVDGAGALESGVSLFRFADDGWDENTTTWANPPDVTGADFLSTNSNGQVYRGWSQWNLFDSGSWDPSIDQTDGLLSLWLAEASSNDQVHIWCSKEAATDTSGLCMTGLEPFLEVTTAVIPIPAAAWLFGSGLLGLIGIVRCKKHE